MKKMIKKKIDSWIFHWKCLRIKGKKYGKINYADCLSAQYISSLDGMVVNTLPYPAEIIKLYHSRYSVDGKGIESNGPIFFKWIKDLNISFEIVYEEKIEGIGYVASNNMEDNIIDVIVPNNQNDLIIKYVDNDELVQIKVYNFAIYQSYLNEFSKAPNLDFIEKLPTKSMFDIWMRNTLEELTRYKEVYRTKIIK